MLVTKIASFWLIIQEEMILSGKSHSLNEFQTHSIDLTTYKESTKFI